MHNIESKRLKQLLSYRTTKTKKKATKKYKSANPFAEDDEEQKVEDINDDTDNLLPDIRNQLEVYNKLVIWKKIGKSKVVPEPVAGLDEKYDEANNQVNDIKVRIHDLLLSTQKELK